jgi:hypothetical protein
MENVDHHLLYSFLLVQAMICAAETQLEEIKCISDKLFALIDSERPAPDSGKSRV